MMRRAIRGGFLILCLCVPCALFAGAGRPEVNPVALAGIQLQFVGDEQQRTYLGIGSETNLSLAEIKADRLIIAVLNTFCAICQQDAPVLNFMYGFIEQDSGLQGSTKLVAIAAGNTQMEVEQFRRQHQLPFPILADPAYLIGQAIPKNLRTPMLITLSTRNKKSPEVVKWHHGRIESIEDVLSVSLSGVLPDSSEAQGLASVFKFDPLDS